MQVLIADAIAVERYKSRICPIGERAMIGASKALVILRL